MKKLLFIFPLLLSGCAGGTSDIVTTLVKLPTGEIVSAATDRLGVHERVVAAQERTKREFATLQIEEEKTKQERLKQKASVSIEIKDKDSLALWALAQANENLARSNEIIGEALAVASGRDRYFYHYLESNEAFPEGAFAEFAHAVMGGAADILNTPTAGIVAGGWALDKIFNGRPASNQFNGPVNADNAFNNSTLHQTGSTGNPVIQPAVVKPEVVHADVVNPEIVHADVFTGE